MQFIASFNRIFPTNGGLMENSVTIQDVNNGINRDYSDFRQKVQKQLNCLKKYNFSHPCQELKPIFASIHLLTYSHDIQLILESDRVVDLSRLYLFQKKMESILSNPDPDNDCLVVMVKDSIDLLSYISGALDPFTLQKAKTLNTASQESAKVNDPKRESISPQGQYLGSMGDQDATIRSLIEQATSFKTLFCECDLAERFLDSKCYIQYNEKTIDALANIFNTTQIQSVFLHEGKKDLGIISARTFLREFSVKPMKEKEELLALLVVPVGEIKRIINTFELLIGYEPSPTETYVRGFAPLFFSYMTSKECNPKILVYFKENWNYLFTLDSVLSAIDVWKKKGAENIASDIFSGNNPMDVFEKFNGLCDLYNDILLLMEGFVFAYECSLRESNLWSDK